MAMMGQNGKLAGDQRAAHMLGAPPPAFSQTPQSQPVKQAVRIDSAG